MGLLKATSARDRAHPPRSIVITGASSGIGRALAAHYAAPGVTLHLLGRDEGRLAVVADESRALGATVETAAIDVRDHVALGARLADLDTRAPIDLLIVNAGIVGGTPPDGVIEPADISRAIVETNVLGALNTVHPVVRSMMARKSGQIAFVSSIAGFSPLPDAPSYAASKAAVLSYGLALRSLLKEHGIRVSVICPGYVATPMTEQMLGPKPGALSPGRAAVLIARGLAGEVSVISFPRLQAFFTRIGGLLPETLRWRTQQPFRFRVAPRAHALPAAPPPGYRSRPDADGGR